MTDASTAPVLVLIWNRPDVTRRVMDAVRGARPPRLYVAADGPRADVATDADATAAARRVATDVDWPCRVETLFRERNLGLRAAVSGALNWFFEHEPGGIVLEDDCVPSASFFRYCSELLERYRDDERVMAVSGVNFQFGAGPIPHSYYFSRYNHCWGWAGWRRAWRRYDDAMTAWPEVRGTDRLERVLGSRRAARYWTEAFDTAYEGRVDSWAYRWTLAVWLAGGLTALPRVNLVSNVGFGDGATHTTDAGPLAALPTHELEFPLDHPPTVEADDEADRRTFEVCYRPPTLAGRVRHRLARLLSS